MTKGDDTTRADTNVKAAARMRKWRAANPPTPEQKAKAAAKAAARIRKWRAANPPTPEQKAKAAEKSRKWRQENKQRYNAYLKAWRESNREHIDAKQRAAGRKPAGKSTAVTDFRLYLLRFLSFLQPL